MGRLKHSAASAVTASRVLPRRRHNKAASPRVSPHGRKTRITARAPLRWRRVGLGVSAYARPSCRGTGRCSGPMPIRTFSITPSGRLAMTMVTLPTLMTIFSTVCSGAKPARRPNIALHMHREARLRAARTSAAMEEICTQPGTGITAWPFAEINSKVGLKADQKQLLDHVRSAGQTAATVFKTSCPAKNAFAMTPPGRLEAMTLRLTATLEAVQTVKPAMEAFYNSLSDEQKERFNEIGPKHPKDNTGVSHTSAENGKSCSEPKAGLSNLPIERIEDAVKPTDAQEGGLKHLENATAKAVSIMQAACPGDTPITPPGRLEAMEKRLQAMINAANTVKPALNDFYGSLSSEQKARFNRIGGELAHSGN